MPKTEYDPKTRRPIQYSGGGQHDNASEKAEDDDSVMTDDEVQAEGGLGALARKRRKPSAGSQGDALKARPTPRSTPTPRPRSGGSY